MLDGAKIIDRMNQLEVEGNRLFEQASGAENMMMNLWLIELQKFKIKTEQVFGDGYAQQRIPAELLGEGVIGPAYP